MASALPGYTDTVGIQAYANLPSNSSLIVADSRYRPKNREQSPTDFVAELSGAIDCKEIFYNELIWNQPLYSHNMTNNELIFQFTNDGGVTWGPSFVVYAMPYLSYTSFDGNKAGASYQTPIGNSYANQMEYALNNDVRLLSSNTQLTSAGGKAYFDPNDPTHSTVQMYFRFSCVKGFVIYFYTDTRTYARSMRIMPCSWIEKAHFVHGFGSYDGNSQKYVPYNDPIIDITSSSGVLNVQNMANCYHAEVMATLLPNRYISITTIELTKDRKIPSYHSDKAQNFQNEIAVLPLNYQNSGVMMSHAANQDTTTVSMRWGYQPQSFRISINGEDGHALKCANPFQIFLNNCNVDVYSGGLYSNADKLQFFSGTYGGTRASWYMMNMLMFGPPSRWSVNSYVLPTTDWGSIIDCDMTEDDVCHNLTTVLKFN